MAGVHDKQFPNGNHRVAVVASHFSEAISRRLLEPCLKELIRLGVDKGNITVVWVPGSFEIPLVASKLAKKKSVDCVICLGAVIQGETLHFDLICRAASEGIAHVSLETGKPVIFGILTTYTMKQALQRSQPKGENKGKDAAVAAVSMIDLLKKI